MVPQKQNALAQAAAKRVLAELGESISAEDTEASIALRAVELLAEQGVKSTWYYECLALVLLGSRSCLSISGRHYQAATEPVGDQNVITVDLSPVWEDAWGDCARTFIVENGRLASQPQTPEFVRGVNQVLSVHARLREIAQVDMTFEELHAQLSEQIEADGFENLDFGGNLGHTIANRLEDRQYLEAGNRRQLGDVGMFTLEPHIRSVGSKWGFKHENIYYWDATAGCVCEL